MAIGPLVIIVDVDDGLDVPTMCCVGAEVREFDGLVALGALVGATDSWLSRELGAFDVGVAVTLTGTFIEGLAVLVGGAVELVGTDVDDGGDGLAVVGRSLLVPNVVGLVVPIVIFIGDLVGIIVLTTTLGVGRVVGDGSSVVVAMDVGAGVGAVVELLLAVVGALDAELDGLLVEPIIVAVGKLVGTPPPSLASVGL